MNINRMLIKDPFFICYDSRSGSTFLANLLVKNLNVSIPPESSFIPRIFRFYPYNSVENNHDLKKLLDIIYSEKRFNAWNIDRSFVRKYFKDKISLSIKDFILAICTIYRNNDNSSIENFGIKKGSYINLFKKIKELFPKSKFIGLIRDGRAIFNSKKNNIRPLTGKPFNVNPFIAAKQWVEYLNKLREIERKNENIMIIYYENMVNDTMSTVKRISNFLGTSINESIVKRQYVISPIDKNIHKNIYKKPLKHRIYAWKKSLSKDEIIAFESIAYKSLIREGYKLINSKIVFKNHLKLFKIKLRYRKWWLMKLHESLVFFAKQPNKIKRLKLIVKRLIRTSRNN